jgi:hypothetical protein
MRELVKSFAELLNQVAVSVDIVDRSTFKRDRDHVVKYMRNALEAADFGLMTRSVIDGQPGLQTTWSSKDQGSGTTIRTGERYPGRCRSPSTSVGRSGSSPRTKRMPYNPYLAGMSSAMPNVQHQQRNSSINFRRQPQLDLFYSSK